MSKILVSYFSATNTTKIVAEKIKDVLNCDLFEIEPVEKYTADDLNWHDKNSRSSIEMQDKNSRPGIKTKVSNLNDYDKIIIGFPVWWYTAPTIINTFIEENDFTNKQVYIFVTSGGSSEDGSFNDLKNKYSSINFIKAKRFNYNTTKEDIEDFINN